jgi:hypothetical protein
MAYTIPYAGGWQNFPDTSTPITAATLNAISNELASYNAAWTSHTPTLTAATTNPNLGGGSTSGNFLQIGSLVIYRFSILFGAGATAGTGVYRVSLPVTAASLSALLPVGSARAVDSSASLSAIVAIRLISTTNLEFMYTATYPTGTINNISGASPWTWADADSINGQAIYQAA